MPGAALHTSIAITATTAIEMLFLMAPSYSQHAKSVVSGFSQIVIACCLDSRGRATCLPPAGDCAVEHGRLTPTSLPRFDLKLRNRNSRSGPAYLPLERRSP